MICPICFSKHARFFAKMKIYVFYRCIDCKTIFLSSLPSKKSLDSYYKQAFSYKDGLLNENIIRKRSGTILRTIRGLAPQAKTICDVGSGYGYFLDEAQHVGYKVQGIEPSQQLANHATNHFKMAIHTGKLKDYSEKIHKRFDVVTCIHVIEHITDPYEFIAQLWKLAKPGGLLYLETPNSDSHLLYTEKENYTFLIPPEHLWIFSRFSISRLLPKNITSLLMNTYSYPEHFMGIVKILIHPKNKNRITYRTHKTIDLQKVPLRKMLSYFLFDRLLAPLFTGILNLNHKGSILELYIKKKEDKSGL